MTVRIPVAIPKEKTGFLVILFSLLLFLSTLMSLSMGYIDIPIPRIPGLIAGQWFGPPPAPGSTAETHGIVLMDVRLPRILASALVGAALALSGVLFQGILLNPLADPYTLGVSAGAAFGACIAILLNLSLTMVSIPLFAFAGACTTLILVLFLAHSPDSPTGGFASTRLILSGIIVAAILSAGISFLKFIADEQVSVIIFWLMGSFAGRTWGHVGLVGGFLVIGGAIAMVFSRDLNLIALGDRAAISLGVNLKQVTVILLLTGSLLSAICVSISGIIGFVGLLVPHTMRFLVGPDNRKLLPIAALAGAVVLLWADTVTRAVLPHEIPIGVLTALIGGPLFCWIFKRRRIQG